MFADVQVYLWAVISNWAGLIWDVLFVADLAGLMLRKAQYSALGDWLDQNVLPEDIRVPIVRTLLIVGLFIAGFIAWDEQYQIATKGPSNQVEQLGKRMWAPLTDNQIATIKDEAKGIGGLHSFRIIYDCTDNCRDVVDAISSALRQADWKEDFAPASAPSWDAGRGIWIDQAKNDGGADALVASLKDAHLPAERKPMGGTKGSPLIKIVIGDRPTH